jgi:signal transduction histidine kinase
MVRQLGIDSAYSLTGFPIAIVGFVLLVTGFSVGLGMVVLVIGIPILIGTVYAARGLADLERLRIPAVLRRPRVRPAYPKAPPGAGIWRRLLQPLGQSQSWLDLLHGVFGLPLAMLAFSVTLAWWASALGGVFYWAYDWALPRSDSDQQLHELLGLADTTQNRILFNTAIGIFFLLTLPLVTRGVAVLSAGFSRGLLTGVAEIRGTIATLEQRRAAAVSAEATALRRLERDIHDGPQQRLVRLAMDLSRAQQQLERNPQAVRETLDDALLQTRETLDELRALSRGIAPPILADRGLPSALAALAGRCVVPVDLAVDNGIGRLDPAVENTAYFVVAEALANVAKHSQATECWLTVAAAQGRLGIVVRDDGAGGAHASKGHGLAGLADRVHAIGGTLAVTSPPGGPTEIRAELPC